MSDYIKQIEREWQELRDLYQTAASALVWPESVKIRWQTPHGGTNGCVSKTRRGMFIVDISESMSVERTYEVFLEEMAHILADGDTLAPSDYWKLPPDAVQYDQAASIKSAESPLRKLREERAAWLAAELEAIAETDAYDHYRWNDPTVIHAKLRALANARRSSGSQ